MKDQTGTILFLALLAGCMALLSWAALVEIAGWLVERWKPGSSLPWWL